MTKNCTPQWDVQIYPTSILEFELGLTFVEEMHLVSEHLKQHCLTQLKDGYRVLALTHSPASNLTRISWLRSDELNFDDVLVTFVNTGTRCAIVVDAIACAAEPSTVVALLTRINRLCLKGSGIDVISVLMPSAWKDEFLAMEPIAQAYSESVKEDAIYQAEAARSMNSNSTEVAPTFHKAQTAASDSSVTARVHLAGLAMQAFINANPACIEQDMFRKAVGIADQLLLELSLPKEDYGVAP